MATATPGLQAILESARTSLDLSSHSENEEARALLQPPDGDDLDEEEDFIGGTGTTTPIVGFGGDKDREKAGRRTLKGFYCYSIASEVRIFLTPHTPSPSSSSCDAQVFAIVSLSLFLPVCLEQFARENGFESPGHVLRCLPSDEDVHQRMSLLARGGGDPTEPTKDAVRCAVRLLGRWIDTASFSLFVYSASVAIQAIVVISMGGLGNNPVTRHRLLTFFATLGSLLTISFFFLSSSSPLWPLAALLALGANVSFGASLVCLNSYLPDLGRSHPSSLAAHSDLLSSIAHLKSLRALSLSSSTSSFPPSHSRTATVTSTTSTSDEILLASRAVSLARQSYIHSKAQATSTISSRGIAMGYAAGILVLVALLGPVMAMRGSSWSLRVAIGSSGIWWALGSLPATIWLRPMATPTPPISNGSSYKPLPIPSFRASLKESWVGLWKMLKEWRRLPQTFLFLAAWFLLSDAFSTLTSTAMLFGKTSLSMSTASLIIISVLSPSSGILGAISFPILQRRISEKTRFQWENKRVLVGLVGLATLVPIWGLVELRRKGEMFALAILFGGVYGSFQSYSRTVYSEIVPTSQAARFFGIYSITDKSSSFLGPLLVAVITDATGNIRHGFILILSMLLLALPILMKVNMDKGRNDAGVYNKEAMRVGLEGESEDGDVEE